MVRIRKSRVWELERVGHFGNGGKVEAIDATSHGIELRPLRIYLFVDLFRNIYVAQKLETSVKKEKWV